MTSMAQRWQELGWTDSQAQALLEQAQDNSHGPLLQHLLLRGLWDEVVDESLPRPQWLDRWKLLGESGFPFIDSPALQRLLDAGVDVHDLTDVVRSAQVLTIYNAARLLEDPCGALGHDVEDGPELQLAYVDEAGACHRPDSLHGALEALDPARRHGQPRTLELRQFGGLPAARQEEISEALAKKRWPQAAVLWQRAVGGDLQHCLAAMKRLAPRLRGAAGGPYQ